MILIELRQPIEAEKALLEARKKGLDDSSFQELKSQILRVSNSEEKPKLATKTGNADSATPSQEQLSKLLEHYQSGRFNDAENLAQSMTDEFPRHPFGWKVLGALFGQSGRHVEAVKANQTAVSLFPQDAEAHSNLGLALQELGRLDEAEASSRQAIALKSDYVEAHINLGNTLRELGRFEEAEASYRQAIVLAPDYAEAHNNLGCALQEMNRFDEGAASVRQAISLEPTAMMYFDNLLFSSNYNPQLSSAALYREYEAYNEAVSALKLRQFDHQDRRPVADRRIRIGYSSADFCAHSCRFFIEPIFRNTTVTSLSCLLIAIT